MHATHTNRTSIHLRLIVRMKRQSSISYASSYFYITMAAQRKSAAPRALIVYGLIMLISRSMYAVLENTLICCASLPKSTPFFSLTYTMSPGWI